MSAVAPGEDRTRQAGGRSLVLCCDGASRGNPGRAGAGAVLLAADGQPLDEICRYLGETTNNQAEYQGLILGLEMALRHRPARLVIRLDSELIVRQVEGRYKVRNAGLRPLHERVTRLLGRLPAWRVEHVDRSRNARADALANRAIDEAASGAGA